MQSLLTNTVDNVLLASAIHQVSQIMKQVKPLGRSDDVLF